MVTRYEAFIRMEALVGENTELRFPDRYQQELSYSMLMSAQIGAASATQYAPNSKSAPNSQKKGDEFGASSAHQS